MGCSLAEKLGIFCYKIFVLKLNFPDEVSVMPIACIFFSLFKVNTLLFSYQVVAWVFFFFFLLSLQGLKMGTSVDENGFSSSSYVVEYILIFLFQLGLKMGPCLFKQNHVFLQKCSFPGLISKMKVTSMLIAYFLF